MNEFSKKVVWWITAFILWVLSLIVLAKHLQETMRKLLIFHNVEYLPLLLIYYGFGIVSFFGAAYAIHKWSTIATLFLSEDQHIIPLRK